MRRAKVLTLEEVINKGDELMWLEYKTANVSWLHSILCPTSPYSDNKMDGYSVSFQSGHVQIQGSYGRQWRCWTKKPSEEQRKGTEWNKNERVSR